MEYKATLCCVIKIFEKMLQKSMCCC